MIENASPIDLQEIEQNPKALRAAIEEVRRTGASRVIRFRGEAVALLSPPPATEATASDQIEAVQSLPGFGAWKGLVDPEEFKRQRRTSQ